MEFLVPLVVLLFSAILHEIMHGLSADKLGDPTARVMGRLTLNPVPHLDPVMSILLPALLVFSGSPIIFGAAKPVPVNPLHFKDPKKDMALTALAGPLTNVFIALIAAFIFKFVFPGEQILTFISVGNLLSASPEYFAGFALSVVIYINLILAFINLIPIPPLDGSKVFAAFLPNEIASSYLSIGQYGIFILFFLLLFPIGGFSLGQILNSLIMYTLQALGI
jgi:Zn-dependent protease